jgi:hypothetical protein
MSSWIIGLAVSMEMAKPSPSAVPRMTWVVMPTTSAAELTSGPPELPGLMAASVWIAPGIMYGSSWISRSVALTTPRVTVGPPGRFKA